MNTAALTNYGKVLTPERLEAIVELTEDGMTAGDIADHLGISKRTVEQGRRVMDAHPANPTRPGLPVDEVAVMRATWGDPVNLHHDELSEAVAILTGRGVSHSQIARTLRVSVRTVQRHVSKLRAA